MVLGLINCIAQLNFAEAEWKEAYVRWWTHELNRSQEGRKPSHCTGLSNHQVYTLNILPRCQFYVNKAGGGGVNQNKTKLQTWLCFFNNQVFKEVNHSRVKNSSALGSGVQNSPTICDQFYRFLSDFKRTTVECPKPQPLGIKLTHSTALVKFRYL